VRFEEDASPVPRAAECARFFPLLLGAGIVGGKGESACVTGVDAALDKTRTPLAADIPARAFRLPSPRGPPGCVQQLGGISNG
jgi:hypothetical protein